MMIRSRFKIILLIFTFLCCAFAGIAIYKISEFIITDFDRFVHSFQSEDLYAKILIPFGLLGFLWSPYYFIKYFKILKIFPENIEVNYLFPIFNKNFHLKDFDFYILVDEMTKNVPVEAIWFIKDDKVKLIIPGQLYSNYYEIRQVILKCKIANKGKIKLNPFHEIKARLGFKINKIEKIIK